MKKEWKAVPLEALAVQQKGAIKIGPFGSQLKKCDLVDSGIHVVGIENVLNGKFDGLGQRFISAEKFKKLRTVEIFPGDLLITMMGTIGRVAIVPDGIGTSILDSHLLRVRPDQKLCRTEYLAWAIYGSPAVQQTMDAKAHGSIMRGLNSAIVRSLPILLPPLPEQRRIVGLLDEAFDGFATAKANAEKNLQNARALFESHLNAVFTDKGDEWEERRIEEIADVRSGKRVPKGYKYEDEPTTYPYIRVSDFSEHGSVRVDGLKYLSKDVFESISRYVITDADVYITIVGATVGKAGIVPSCLNGANLTENACRLVFTGDVAKRFAYFFTQSESFKRQVGTRTRVAAQPKLALSRLKNILIPLPPIDQQHLLAKTFDELRRCTILLEGIYQRKLAALDELKKSLLHQTFSGQL